MAGENKFLTKKDLCQRWGITGPTIERYLAEGVIKTFRKTNLFFSGLYRGVGEREYRLRYRQRLCIQNTAKKIRTVRKGKCRIKKSIVANWNIGNVWDKENYRRRNDDKEELIMENKQIQEIIDYLDSGDKFRALLLKELDRPDLKDYERRTYASLHDALTGALELYCSMSVDDEEDSGNVIRLKKTTIEEAVEELEGWAIDFISTTYQSEYEDIKSGINFRFVDCPDGETRLFKNLLVKTDGTVYISNWY